MSRTYREQSSLQSCSRAVTLLAFALAALAPIVCSAYQQTTNPKLARPIVGSRMLVGKGEVQNYAIDCFLYLCGKASPDVVVVSFDGEPKVSVDRWRQRGANSVYLIDSIPSDSDQMVLSLLKADGVWFESEAKPLRNHPLFPALLRSITERGGVIAGAGIGASEITGQSNNATDDNGKDFGLLVRSTVRFQSLKEKPASNSADNDTNIQWYIPNTTALIVHNGRQVASLGPRNAGARLAGKNGWPERIEVMDSPDVYDLGDAPSYSLDLLSWFRSSIERQGPVFPPKKAPASIIEKGTLILHGGSGVDDNTFNRFIAAAGGKGANFVCIPSASNFESNEAIDSYSARRLSELGCKNVTILHTADPVVADQDARFLSSLEKAQGVWIDGGRTYRMMDRFEHTKAAELMRELLAKDGVIGGSSAGCQVAGDFLVRGNPRTNRDLVFEGYTRGFGFLEGVVLDAHFLQRGRGETFFPLMKQYPQLLGIGVDEKTAILVRGSVAEVLGSEAVSFYEMSNGDSSKPLILKGGSKYDMEQRKQIK